MLELLGARDLETVLRSMREGLQIIDKNWRYVYLNDAAAAHGRRAREELLGRTMMECYPGIETTPMFDKLRQCMEHGASSALDNQFTYPDGTTRGFELRIEPCVHGIMILSVDVTEGRRLETQLRQAQKMEAIGRLAGSIAHDFNNLLSVILSYSDMLLDQLKPVDPVREDITAIRSSGQRAADLTRQLLAFSRQQILSPRVLDLNEVVQGSERMLRRLVGEDIELVGHYGADLPHVRVDAGQIDQVVMNLAINARDAMPNGGKLTIETAAVVLDDTYVSSHFEATPGRYVMLAVTDTGIGMDRETQLRIFEPFFSTKGEKGTGLGLATVFGIVKQSGGSIWVYSELNAGTTFKIYLPIPVEQDIEVPVVSEPETLSGSETILLVEDQDDVRVVARQIMRRHGYHVLEASNAGEALLICERHPRDIHLLLTDVVMPRMSGRELAERLREVRPSLRILYMSGYTENSIVHHGILDPGISYLQKPILPDALARKLREVLDAPAPRKRSPRA